MNLRQVNVIPSSQFSALLASDELLQVNNNTISIVDVHTGFVKNFNFLQSAPNGCYYNNEIPNKLILTFKNKTTGIESLQVIDPYTGEKFREIVLHTNKDGFNQVSVGTNIYFTLKANPNVLYFMPFQDGQIAQLDMQNKINAIIAHPTENKFYIYKRDSDKQLSLYNCKEGTPEWSRPLSEYKFFKFVGTRLAIGFNSNRILLTDDDFLSNSKDVTTPHGTTPIDCAENIAISSDGFMFSTETNKEFGSVLTAQSIFTRGCTVAVVSSTDTYIYEVSHPPLAFQHNLQPGMPFHKDVTSIDSQIFFATGPSLFCFNTSGNVSITKFTTIQNGIVEKVAYTPAITAVRYKTSEVQSKKIMVFSTGTLQRDEVGIDCCAGSNGDLYLLTASEILVFTKKGISLTQKTKYPAPDHRFNTIFAAGDDIVLYTSETGEAAVLRDGRLVPFRLPREAKIINWPVICTSDTLYYITANHKPEDLSPQEDFEIFEYSISSCVWFGWTLFAVIEDGLYALSVVKSDEGTSKLNKRKIMRLPNSSCAICAVYPSRMVFVTTVPQLSVFTEERPVCIDILPDVPAKVDPQMFARLLAFLPKKRIDPLLLRDAPPIVCISTFMHCGVSSVTPFVADMFARFGLLQQLIAFCEDESDTRLVAERARKFGQFNFYGQLLDMMEDGSALLELYVILRAIENLQGMVKNYPNLTPCIKLLGVEPNPDAEYKPLIDLPLPKCKEPIFAAPEFTLYIGTLEDEIQLFPSSFDDLENFGRRVHVLTGSEAETANATLSSTVEEQAPPEPEPEDPNIEIKEKPKEDPEKDIKKLALDAYFQEDDEPKSTGPLMDIKINTDVQRPTGPKKPIKIGFQLNIANQPATNTRRRSTTTKVKRNDSMDLDQLGDLSTTPQRRAQVSNSPSTDMFVSSDPMGTLPSLNDDNNEIQNSPMSQAPFQSSLFLDI